jgi:predicted MPP superfamily phosphohydrolase
MKRQGARPLRRRARFVVMVASLAIGVQIPGILTLARVTGSQAAAFGGAGLITLPFLWSALRNPFEHRSRSRVHLHLFMWPFYLWWTICLTHLLFAPLALLVAALSRASLDQALAVAGGLSVASGFAALRRSPRIVRHRIGIADLPPELEGYRIAQLSDLHCGPFTPAERVRRWVARANALAPDLMVVTGDLITSGDEYVEVVAAELGGLRATDGVFGSMGNHDYFTDGDKLADALERHGMTVLRNRGLTITRGAARLHVAGVDDTWTRRHDVPAALRERPTGTPVVLLAHDPDLFVEAAAHGVDLTLSGHTHGGQIAIPGAPRVNMARILTPFTAGIFHAGGSTLFVNRGLGTTGPPVRIGARPEIAVLELRRAPVSEALLHDLAEEAIREASQDA